MRISYFKNILEKTTKIRILHFSGKDDFVRFFVMIQCKIFPNLEPTWLWLSGEYWLQIQPRYVETRYTEQRGLYSVAATNY